MSQIRVSRIFRKICWKIREINHNYVLCDCLNRVFSRFFFLNSTFEKIREIPS